MVGEGAMNWIVRAHYDVWRALTLGEMDPLNALMGGKIKVSGNIAAALKHADGFKKTFDIVEHIPTVFD